MSASAPSTVLRARPLLHLLLVAVAAILACGLLPAGVAVAAAPAVEQCNGVDNVGGEEVRCTVTVANTLDLATGVGAATVTVQECHGPAGAPICGPMTSTTYADVVLSVRQCEGSGSGGGGRVTCSVTITNDVTGAATTAPATVNQCNGSGQDGGTAPTTSCSPLGSTTGATVTQCNGSGNGGGGTLRVRCDVDPSTQTAALPVSITQCNGSGNGGGATVTCRSSVTSRITAAAVAPSPSPSTSPSASPSASPSVSPSASASPSASPSVSPSVSPPASPTAGATPSASTSPSAVPTPGLPDEQPLPGPLSPVPAPPVTGTTDTPITALPPVGALPPGDSSQNVPQLPRTGSDLGLLALSGLLLLGIGGLTLLLGARPRYVGRHELRV